MLVVNKIAITAFPAPSTLLFFQLFSSSFSIYVTSKLGLIQLARVSRAHMNSYAIVSFTFLAALLSNIKVLQYANVETFIVFRASTPLAISVLDYIFLERDLPSLRSSMSLLGLILGAVSYVATDSHFEVRAYAWVFCWYIIFCFDQIYIKHVVDSVKLSSWTNSFWTNTIATIPALLLAVKNSEHRVAFGPNSVFFVTLSCFVGVMMSGASFHLRGLVSATYFTIIGTLCKVLSVLINYVIWDKHASVPGLLSLGFCILSATFYHQSPLRSTARKTQAAVVTTSRFLRCCAVSLLFFSLVLSLSKSAIFNKDQVSTRNSISRKALVIVIGSIRGGHYAWKSFQRNLLLALDADFAYLGPDDPKLMTQAVDYNWQYADLADWGAFFDTMASSRAWRHMCSEFPRGGAQFLGGVRDCQPGSAGLLLAYREILLERILQHGLMEKYEWFVLTRSDQLHLCEHEPLQSMNRTSVNVAEGEDYGGISDRHAVYPRSVVLQGLGVTRDLLHNSQGYVRYFNDTGIHMNLEAVLKRYFDKSGLPVQRFRRSFFGVARRCDKTRWSEGTNHSIGDILGLKIKYVTELEEAQRVCEVNFTVPEGPIVDDC